MKAVKIIFGAILLSLTATTSFAARPFTVNDLVMLERVSDPRVSPDGKNVVYQLRQTDYAANKGMNSIWVMPLSKPKAAKQISEAGKGASSPRWSIDGKTIYFLGTGSGSSQVWRVDANGKNMLQVSDYPLDVGSFLLSPNGKQMLVSAEVFLDCGELSCTKKRLDQKTASKQSGVLHEKLFIRHWDTWANGTRSQLFITDFGAKGKAGRAKLLSRGIDGDVPSKPFGDDSEYTFSPDGESVVFSARIAGKTEAWSTNFDLFSVPVLGDQMPRNLTKSNPAWDTGPVFSKDGKTLYFRAMKRAGFEADRFAIYAMDMYSGNLFEWFDKWDHSAETIVLSEDEKTLYTHADSLGQHAIFALDFASQKAHDLTGKGHVGGFSLSKNNLVFARDHLQSPAQLFALDLKNQKEKPLSNFNSAKLAELQMGAPEQFSFAGWNNETVYGHVVKPAQFVEGKKYPIAFIVHGGPQGSMGNTFHYRWNPQTYAGQGFATVFIDFHGSTGYGQAFTDSISGDWGGKPLQDLQKGMAAALSKYSWLDGTRACALGGSYGGYMVNWIAGKWNEAFDCIVSHASIFDNRFMAYSTEELWFDEWEFLGTPYDVPERLEQHNPINHVKNWKVPTLVVHGALDYRVPLEQGISVFTALQRRGIESQFLFFPDENHWILKPQNSVQWHDTVNAWLKKWAAP